MVAALESHGHVLFEEWLSVFGYFRLAWSKASPINGVMGQGTHGGVLSIKPGII